MFYIPEYVRYWYIVHVHLRWFVFCSCWVEWSLNATGVRPVDSVAYVFCICTYVLLLTVYLMPFHQLSRRMLKSLVMIGDLSTSYFSSFIYCFIYFDVLFLGPYHLGFFFFLFSPLDELTLLALWNVSLYLW